MQLVILAAGMGSRFGGLKQLEKMDDAGNFLLDYSVYDAKMAGFDSVVFVIKKDFAIEFKESIGKRVEKIIKVEYAYQDLNDIPEGFSVPEGREKPWGTAHAIYAARDLIHEDFIIINGDDFYGRETFQVAHDFLAGLKPGSRGKYANVAFEVRNTMTENGSVKRGIAFEDDNHYLTKLIESKVERVDGKVLCTPLDESLEPFNCSEDTPVSMNLFCFNVDLIDELKKGFVEWMKVNGKTLKEEYLIPTVVDTMVREGRATLKLLSTPAVWFGVTYKEDKPMVVESLNKLVEKGVYKKGLY